MNDYSDCRNKLPMLHIGSIIESVIRSQGRSISWIAKELCYERTNLYNILHRESVDTQLLLKLSIILDFDFFKCFSDQTRAYKEAKSTERL